MRFRHSRLMGLVAVTAAASLIAACSSSATKTAAQPTGSFKDCAQHANTCNTGTPDKGGTLVAISEKTVVGWNELDFNASTFDLGQILGGVVPTPFIVNPDLSVTLNADLLTSATQTNANPQTIVYKINPKAVWSDGSPITADDFTWAWKTQDGVAADCPAADCQAASTAGYSQIQTIAGSGTNNQTVTVTFKTPFSDWKQLFTLLPSHIAATAAGPTLGAQWKWFNNTTPTWSGGPYIIAPNGYVKDASVTLVPNPKWYGAVQPSLDKLVYKIITDQTAEVPALQNGEVNYMYPQPNQDIVTQTGQIKNVKSELASGLTWEHLDLNLKSPGLADLALRQAIFTAVNTKDIISKTVGLFDPSIQPLGSHNFVPGQNGYKDLVTPTGQGSGDIAKATSILTAAGYTNIGAGKALTDKSGKAVPAFKIVYTTGNTIRQQEAELVQASLAQLGVKVNIVPTSDLGDSLGKGEYDMIIFAWVGGPFPAQGAQQLWTMPGGGDYNSFVDPQSDQLLSQAGSASDLNTELSLINQSDQILTNDAVVLPLYQKPVFLAVNTNVVNVRGNATSVGPAYNVQDWGLSKTAQ